MLNAVLTTTTANMATPVDQHVGRRIRGKRRALGLSEENLATALGVETDRIAAYERALARVPSDHLIRLSEVLGVPLSYFFPARPFAPL